MKIKNRIPASLVLVLLISLSCVACAKSPNSTPFPSQSNVPTSSPTGFHIIGNVNFSVAIPVVVSASQLNSISIVGASVLRLKDGSYRMYLQSRDQANNVDILSLSSTDGLRWLIDPGTRIQHGNEKDLDTEAGEPDAYIGPDGKYYMAYTGRQPDISTGALIHRIIFAVSDDSLTWTKLGTVYSDPRNINAFAASSDVIKIGDKYIMNYTGGINIIYATSVDSLNWKRGNVLFSAGHDSTTVYLNGTYYMFAKVPANFRYGYGSGPSDDDALIMAISTDGINWSSGVYRVVVENTDGTEMANLDLQDPAAIVLNDGLLHLYVNDNGGQNIISIKPAAALPTIQ